MASASLIPDRIKSRFKSLSNSSQLPTNILLLVEGGDRGFEGLPRLGDSSFRLRFSSSRGDVNLSLRCLSLSLNLF